MKVALASISFASALVLSSCAMHSSMTTNVQARFVPERMDDFAFENDKVAFRLYGPALKDSQESNGTDCWLKRVDYPIIDKWYKGHTEGVSYHEDHGEGYDPFHVGSSLGCGGIALYDRDSDSADKLIQPNVYTHNKVIEKTNDKVTFELQYNYPKNIKETKRITIAVGSQFYKAESSFTQNGKPVQLEVAVGLTTHDGKAIAKVNSEGDTVTTWETIDGEGLGTAVALPKFTHTQYIEQQIQDKDRSHALLITNTSKEGKITYYAGFAWSKAGEITNFEQWQNYADSYLETRDINAPVTASSVKRLTQKVADWQIKHHEEQGKDRAIPRIPPWWMNRERYHDLEWHHGALYAGMNEWRKIADDSRYTQWLKEIGERNNWSLHQRPYHADDHTVGQFYLDFYEDFHQPEMLKPTKKQFDWILANPKTGTLDWEAKNTHAHDRWGWADALFMAPPVWARLAKLTGEEKYLNFMDQEYKATYDLLWSEKDQLFWRDSSYFTQREKNGEDIFWSRGNGWVFGGLALMIPDLPPSWEGRDFYVDLFKKMAARIVQIQRQDGTWSMGLLGGTEGYPIKETSGTAFFTYGIAWGINQGYLDQETYRPVVMKSWRALRKSVTDEGMLAFVQPVGAAPGDSFPDFTEVYGVGAFLAAGTEMYKMLSEEDKTNKHAANSIKTLMYNTGWCWFQDPRAIIQNDKLIIGGVAGNGIGDAAVGVYDLNSNQLLGRSTLQAHFEHDDHNSPVFYARPDGQVLTVYAKHNTEKKHYYRTSTSDNYLNWGPEKVLESPANVTYMNLYNLSDEDTLYNLYRGIDWNPTYVTSKDGGLTWSNEHIHLIQNEVEGYQRPYARYAGNGKDTIGLSFTDAHPRDFGNSIYYAEFRYGNFYKVDGTLIKNLKEDGPLKPSEAEKLFQGGGGDYRSNELSAEKSAWTSSVAFDKNGYPHIAYTYYINNQDQRYRLASWDGKQWHDREIAYAGSRLYDREASYTGLVSLEPNNPNHVVISTNVDPNTGKALDMPHQIFRANIQLNDETDTIHWEQLTNDPHNENLRPMIVNGKNHNVILWLQGQFNTYTDYYLDAVGLSF
ncbi:glycoside hydrolase family 88 protein [Pseudoalteromonas shioyasakiensis]|uniref:glycoside hydrolase family 88 protein n=1 Tax=Pseudoalteromonas shioyasakiensis TaxID=1190813 RepID=UPI0025520A8C|nr:glycoside hydrolase family 88 protein [Pseudoalteromonas shioyasakiensis]MDK9683414.1 glycoside hydrolase family 88 protein [Pseudoalteromonas shioyasakiensis]